MKYIRSITYLLAGGFAVANLFYLTTQSPYQLLFFTMVFNVLAGAMSWQAYINNDKITPKENLKLNLFCWTFCAIIWFVRFLSILIK